jgi:hypothetical protein
MNARDLRAGDVIAALGQRLTVTGAPRMEHGTAVVDTAEGVTVYLRADAAVTVTARRPPTARDRPRPSAPAALLARPTSPPPELVFTAPPLPAPVAPVLAERPQDSEPPTPKPVPLPRPEPDLPSVLNGTLSPRRRPAPGPRPAARPRPRVTASPVDKLAGVHPGIAAGVRAELKKRGLDESRIVVHSPTNVEIR